MAHVALVQARLPKRIYELEVSLRLIILTKSVERGSKILWTIEKKM